MCEQATSNGQRHADTERDHHNIGLGVVAVLIGVIPIIKHLDDGSAKADRQDRRNGESTPGHMASVTRSSGLRAELRLQRPVLSVTTPGPGHSSARNRGDGYGILSANLTVFQSAREMIP